MGKKIYTFNINNKNTGAIYVKIKYKKVKVQFPECVQNWQ